MKLTLTLTGIAPLIVQSDRLVDPLDKITKQIAAITTKPSSKRVDGDHLEIARLEFFGSLYYDAEIGPYLPGDNLQASLRSGGTFSRKGAAIDRALIVLTDRIPLEYEGPRDIDALWAKGRTAARPFGDFEFRRSVALGLGKAKRRVMRSRPIFRKWSLKEVEVELATDQLDLADFKQVAEDAGHFAGIGTWRPRYGRYEVRVVRGG